MSQRINCVLNGVIESSRYGGEERDDVISRPEAFA